MRISDWSSDVCSSDLSTVAGVSLGGMKAMHAQGDLPIPGVEHVRQPYAYGEGQGMSEEEFCDACVQAIEDKILEVGPQHCAAFIGEPVQGAGGVIIPPKDYWPKVEAVVRQYERGRASCRERVFQYE